MSTATVAQAKPPAKQEVEKKFLPILNIDAIQQRADAYGAETFMPRVVGQSFDHLDDNGQPLMVGKLFIMPEFVEDLDEAFEGILQHLFQRAAHQVAGSLNADSAGRVKDEFRVVPSIPGTLRVVPLD